MISKLIRIFAFTLGSVLVALICYASYQENYIRLLSQERCCDVKSDEDSLDYKTNHNPDNYEDIPFQSERSDLVASDEWPRPSSVPVTSHKEECLPFFKDLRVKAVAEHDCDQPHVLMNQGGRLGNNLCQYASLYLLRHLYGVRVSIEKPMHHRLSKIIKNLTLPVEDGLCFTNKTRRLKYDAMYMMLYTAASQVKTRAIDNMIKEPLLNTSYFIFNNPGPRSLLMAHRDLVRSLFPLRDEVISQAIHNIDQALKALNATYHHRNFPVVTVHVRRTDYSGYIKGKFNLTQLDELYFKRAFKFYKTRLSRPVFLVLSDDFRWCKQNLLARDVIIVATSSSLTDIVVMSLGDHHITSYGTYSFSGALLGRGHITHPIGHNRKYNLVDCVDSPFFHHISRDKSYEVDNSKVVLS